MRGIFLSIAFASTWLGCVTDAPTTADGGKKTGEEGGPCFDNGTCNAGLVCVVPNTCKQPDASTAMDSSTSDTGGGMDASDAGSNCVPNALALWKGENQEDFFGTPALHLNINNNAMLQAAKVGKGFLTTATGWFNSMGPTSLFSAKTKLTVEFWIKFATTSQNPRRVLDYTETNNTNIWAVQIAGSLYIVNFFVNNNGSSAAATLPQDTNFHHVAFVFDSTSGSILPYVDGAVQNNGAGTAAGQIANKTGVFTMGKDPTNSAAPYDGLLDEIGIYGAALDAQQIGAIYNAGSSGICRTQ